MNKNRTVCVALKKIKRCGRICAVCGVVRISMRNIKLRTVYYCVLFMPEWGQ